MKGNNASRGVIAFAYGFDGKELRGSSEHGLETSTCCVTLQRVCMDARRLREVERTFYFFG